MNPDVRRVEITRRAERQLRAVPAHIRIKLLLWVVAVEEDGLEETREVRGYHDEPLRGRRAGQRSIRLNRRYRAIYEVKGVLLRFVSVEEVNLHEY